MGLNVRFFSSHHSGAIIASLMSAPPVLDSIVRTGTFTLSLDCPGVNREAISSVIVRRSGLSCEANYVRFNNRVLQLCGVAISISEHGSDEAQLTPSIIGSRRKEKMCWW